MNNRQSHPPDSPNLPTVIATVVAAVAFALTLIGALNNVQSNIIVSGLIIGVVCLLGAGWLYRAALSRSVRRTWHSVRRKDFAVRLFLERSDATPDMREQMRTHQALIFIGLSQRFLTAYLHEVLDIGYELPWQTVQVFFCGDETGFSWERETFKTNLLNARQDVAVLLTDPQRWNQLAAFRNVSFHQYRQPLMYGGSMFGKAQPEPDGGPEFDLVYVVQYLPSLTPDTKQALTWKIRFDEVAALDSEGRRLLKKYIEAYQVIKDDAKILGEFGPTAWDISVREWDDFCTHYSGMRQSVDCLIELAELRGGESVIDVGAGSGFASSLILPRIPNGELTVLESSPQMLSACKRTLGSNGRVHYALCRLPPKDDADIDLGDRRFAVIFCHLAIFEIASTPQELGIFVKWCRSRLVPGGRVVLNGHNGPLDMDRIRGYSNWDDPFRGKMEELIVNQSLKHTPAKRWRMSELDIKNAFHNEGFTLAHEDVAEIPITMRDRLRLWMVPAVFNSLSPVNSTNVSQAKRIVRQAYDSVEHMPTMPRRVMSWVYVRP